MNGTEMKLAPGSRHQLVGGNLVILNPSKAQDAGVYQCLASNPVGTVVSREAVLRFGCETHGGAGEGGRMLQGGAQGLGRVSGKGRGSLPWRLNWGAPPCLEGCARALVLPSSSAGVLQGGTRPRENPRRLGRDVAL